MKKKVFLDNNSTTLLDERVKKAILEELEQGPSNPSSVHSFGQAAYQRLYRAREELAAYFHCDPKELIFTSSGTEALNLAILSQASKELILTSSLEHSSVYQTILRLNKPIHYLPVGKEGCVQKKDIEKNLRANCAIVLSAVNSETGVKNPIFEIAEMAHHYQVPFIVDGVAWLGKEVVSIPEGVTSMAFSGHKIHGPKGIGLLFHQRKAPLSPLITGGGQEFSQRAGTENLAGIIGFTKAISLLQEELPNATFHMEKLRNLLENQIAQTTNGSAERICNTSSMTFSGVDAEALLIQLDLHGIAASMGSACSAKALEPSRILLNMGLTRQEARETLRFSLSRFTTEEEIEYTVQVVKNVVRKSPALV